eukprot:gnl/Chilomastix_cuspidata/965.p1 GENE.gnl/Chilomastix_cuspidata/965~~gnl/Chilomastix_cuspidata/965.p1  ORF type:complete len:925 (+),score=335.01 gnl/Chilomastix_cuspidata/965:23-2776(+)
MQASLRKEPAIIVSSIPTHFFPLNAVFDVSAKGINFEPFEFRDIEKGNGVKFDEGPIKIDFGQLTMVTHLAIHMSSFEKNSPTYINLECIYKFSTSKRVFIVPNVLDIWAILRIERLSPVQSLVLEFSRPVNVFQIVPLTEDPSEIQTNPVVIPCMLNKSSRNQIIQPDMLLSIENKRVKRRVLFPVHRSLMSARVPLFTKRLLERPLGEIEGIGVFDVPEMSPLINCHPFLPVYLLQYFYSGDATELFQFLRIMDSEQIYPTLFHLPENYRLVNTSMDLFLTVSRKHHPQLSDEQLQTPHLLKTELSWMRDEIQKFLKSRGVLEQTIEAIVSSIQDGSLLIPIVKLSAETIQLCFTGAVQKSFFATDHMNEGEGATSVSPTDPLDLQEVTKNPLDYFFYKKIVSPLPGSRFTYDEARANAQIGPKDLLYASEQFVSAFCWERSNSSCLFGVEKSDMSDLPFGISERTFQAFFTLLEFTNDVRSECLTLLAKELTFQMPQTIFGNPDCLRLIQQVLNISDFEEPIFEALSEGQIPPVILKDCIRVVSNKIRDAIVQREGIQAGNMLFLRAGSGTRLAGEDSGRKQSRIARQVMSSFFKKVQMDKPTFGWQGIPEDMRSAPGYVVWYDQILDLGVAAFPGSLCFRFQFNDILLGEKGNVFEADAADKIAWRVIARRTAARFSDEGAKHISLVIPPRLNQWTRAFLPTETDVAKTRETMLPWISKMSASREEQIMAGSGECVPWKEGILLGVRVSFTDMTRKMCLETSTSLGLAALCPHAALAKGDLSAVQLHSHGEEENKRSLARLQEAVSLDTSSAGVLENKEHHEFTIPSPDPKEDMSWLPKKDFFADAVSFLETFQYERDAYERTLEDFSKHVAATPAAAAEGALPMEFRPTPQLVAELFDEAIRAQRLAVQPEE